MDRDRVIKQVKANGIRSGERLLTVIKPLGEGGNGTALLCKGEDGKECVVKLYLPPDRRELDERALSRFESEIKLTTTIRHPNIVRALDSGRLQMGAYSLPFYVMPRAAKTLRDFADAHGNDPAKIEQRMRIFIRAALGVACLHSHGVFHRDIKPENILIGRDGTPWVADLGIAHVNPEFASGGVKTMESERLLNRDYYAPEQRFGRATDVDHRADIYALGYILYELLAGFPPVRNGSPPMSKINEAFAPLDAIFDRMTAHEPTDRFAVVEDAIEELSIAFGWILATTKGVRPMESANVPAMTKLLKSSNDAHRQRGVVLAMQLREEALDTLHQLTGHARRDVRNSAATALGEIAHPSSLPFLVGCLYGGSGRASIFRPSADTAAAAIAHYPVDLRLKACDQISQPIRPNQANQILKDVPKDAAYATVQKLHSSGFLLLDWGETLLTVLATIDEERAWPDIAKEMSDGTLRGFQARELVPALSAPHQRELLDAWIEREKDGWFFEYLFKSIVAADVAPEARAQLLARLKAKVEGATAFKNQWDLLANIRNAESKQNNYAPEGAEVFAQPLAEDS